MIEEFQEGLLHFQLGFCYQGMELSIVDLFFIVLFSVNYEL